MSWGLSVPAGEPDDHLNKRIKAAVKDYVATQPGGEVTAETRDQIDAGVKAARQLAHSGALGDGPIVITVSGHSNPGHAPEPGFSPDLISVTVSRIRTES